MTKLGFIFIRMVNITKNIIIARSVTLIHRFMVVGYKTTTTQQEPLCKVYITWTNLVDSYLSNSGVIEVYPLLEFGMIDERWVVFTIVTNNGCKV